MNLTERLILGCARLTGGASASEADALVRAALDAGIGHIDTAPNYGMGTAEVIVGRALRCFGGPVRITAKLGSSRDPHGYAKSWLRRAKRAFGGSRSDPWHSAPPPARIAVRSGHDFSRAAMQASLALSRDRLGRIDVLLLHDIGAGEVTSPLLADLAGLAAGVEAQPGYASQAQWDAELDARFPAGTVAQCALVPAWLQGMPTPVSANPLFLHSIVKVGAALRSAVDFGERLDRAARIVGTGQDDSDRIAALYAAAGTAAPGARLVIASSHAARLRAVLGAIARIDSAGTAPEIAALLVQTRDRGYAIR